MNARPCVACQGVKVTFTFRRHLLFDNADPGAVIVTLYRDAGEVFGCYIGPEPAALPSIVPDVALPEDRLLGALAVIRAWELSRALGCALEIVDPQDLWSALSGL